MTVSCQFARKSALSAIKFATFVAVLGFAFWPSHSRAADAVTNPDRAATVVKAQRQCFVDTLQMTGVLLARDEIAVRPDREGLKITQVLAEAGDIVVSGQVLARLTAPEGSPGGSAVTAIRAPAAGIVDYASAIVGVVASARAEPLFRIARQGERELVAETPVNTLSRLAADQSAKVEIIGLRELNAKVRLVSATINPTTQLGQVRVLLGNDPQLRAGAFGRAIVDIGRSCGPAVPLSAVSYGQGGTVVQVVRDSQIESRQVSVGLMTDGQIEIREGVAVGDVVVARAGAFFRDGDRIKAVLPSNTNGRR